MPTRSKAAVLVAGIAAVVLAGASLSTWADSPARETQYVEVAESGRYFFVMLPAGTADDDWREARGYAYELKRDGSMEELWSVNGWYSFSTFLTRNGRHLVRMGPWASRPPNEELAAAFYTDGKEHTRYTVADLLEDTTNVRRSISHYQWELNGKGFPRLTSNDRLQILTIENVLITFDATSGELLKRQTYEN